MFTAKYSIEQALSATGKRYFVLMDCPYHDTHDLSGISERCYYCTTTLEDLIYLQKLKRQIEHIQSQKLGTKNYVSQDNSNVYISRIRKENIHSPHRAEVVPPGQKHTPTILDRVHSHICVKASCNPRYEVPETYLHYLSHRIQPEAFCTTEELCLLPERETNR